MFTETLRKGGGHHTGPLKVAHLQGAPARLQGQRQPQWVRPMSVPLTLASDSEHARRLFF